VPQRANTLLIMRMNELTQKIIQVSSINHKLPPKLNEIILVILNIEMHTDKNNSDLERKFHVYLYMRSCAFSYLLFVCVLSYLCIFIFTFMRVFVFMIYKSVVSAVRRGPSAGNKN
jgi:hypothetical protein